MKTLRKAVTVPEPIYEKLRRYAFKNKTKMSRLIESYAATLKA